MPGAQNIYVLRTAFATAQVVEALRSSMDENELSFLFRVSAEGNLPVIGNVEGNRCRLMRRPKLFSTDYAGIFDATIFEERDCTRLDGGFVKMEFGFPLGSNNRNSSSTAMIKIWIAILIIFQAYNFVGSFLESDHPLLNPIAVIAGLFLVILCILLPIAIRLRRQQREFIVNHLKKVLNATQTE